MQHDAQTFPIFDLAVKKIRIDGGTQARVSINTEQVQRYAEILDNLPASIVFFDGAEYWLADGFTRYRSHCQAKRATMRCEVRPGTVRDTILFAVGANFDNGYPRSDDDERHACRMLLMDEEWGQWSDREIARQCRLSAKRLQLVADVRRLLKKEEKERREREEAAKQRAKDKQRQEEQAKETAKEAFVKEGWSRPGGPHYPKPDSEAGKQPEKSEESGTPEMRTFRTKYGTVAEMDVSKIGKGNRRNALRVETNPGVIAKLDEQIKRSAKKFVVQCLRRGYTDEQIHAIVDEWIKISRAQMESPRRG